MKLIIEVDIKALAPSPHQGCEEDRYSATMKIDSEDEYGRIRINDCIEKSRRQHTALLAIAEDIGKAIDRAVKRLQADQEASSEYIGTTPQS